MTPVRIKSSIVLLLIGALVLGCSSNSASDGDTVAPTDTITVESKADTIAHRLLEAHGADAFASAPYLRFNFGVETPSGTNVVARHLWDRTTGDYRVEWSGGEDSMYVALVNVRDVENDEPTGTAYLNGTELNGEKATRARKQAYARFINDCYWLLAPLKTFDPGVNRTYLPDSSTAEHDVLHLSFGDVGLTPGDQYWLYVSTETDRLDEWAFHLEGMDDESPPSRFNWTNYTSLEAPEGTVRLATRKDAVGAEQAILTNNLALPSQPPEDAFSNADPILGSDED